MNSVQAQAFADAAGFHADSLSFDIKLVVGGVALVCSLLMLVGFMHLLDSTSPWDKTLFLVSISVMSGLLMLIFTYVA